MTNNTYYQQNEGFRVDYVIDAPAYTDAPHTIEILMKQRRRWANGFLFGEISTIMNIHNIIGFNGQCHSIWQKLKMLIYMPVFTISKLIGYLCPAIMLTQLKYTFIYVAYYYFNNDYYKKEHPVMWSYFTN